MVYLVNRSKRRLRLPAQDDDIYLKLEARGEDGRWVRAQTHRFSWCGNSYMPFDVPPGTFRTLPGFRPTSGDEGRVRYRVYWREGHGEASGLGDNDELISNTGQLEVDPNLIQLARYDSMALRFADLDTLEAFLFGDVGLSARDRQLDEDSALDRLSELEQPRAVALIERFLAEPALDERRFQQGIACEAKIAPGNLAKRARALITGDPSDRRRWMIKRLTSLDDAHSNRETAFPGRVVLPRRHGSERGCRGAGHHYSYGGKPAE